MRQNVGLCGNGLSNAQPFDKTAFSPTLGPIVLRTKNRYGQSIHVYNISSIRLTHVHVEVNCGNRSKHQITWPEGLILETMGRHIMDDV